MSSSFQFHTCYIFHTWSTEVVLVVHIPDSCSEVLQNLESCGFCYVEAFIEAISGRAVCEHPHNTCKLLFGGKADSTGSVSCLDKIRVVVGHGVHHPVEHVRIHSAAPAELVCFVPA